MLSPSHLKELVPDIAERDVYVCGPPGMIDRILPDLREASVPRHHLHVERFAL
jgi:ferredoxin-NADP reductase